MTQKKNTLPKRPIKTCPHCGSKLSEVGLITVECVQAHYLWKETSPGGIKPDKVDEADGGGIADVLCGECKADLNLPKNPYSDEFLHALGTSTH